MSSISSFIVKALKKTVPKPPPRECLVCAGTKESEEFPSATPTALCTHAVTICKDCMARHLEVEVNSKGLDIVSCPDCRQPMDYEGIRRDAHAHIFERYDMLTFRKTLQKMEDFRWCKVATCGSGQLHEGGATFPIMKCGGCKALSCFVHDVPWHTSKTCQEFDVVVRDNVDEAASRAYVDSKTKPCPECREPIEKNGGCDHMTCRRPAGCGHEFCWLCLAEFNKILRHGNHHHRRTCQYYSAYDGVDDDGA
ncbi:hypothetical protein FRB94_012796 [Tulasnella sp. JGI-2019a]|nr:hypothetical protein FRB94_012796 [Tulasnella sp. JGI-2019a]